MPQIRVFIADADVYLRDKIRQLIAIQGDMVIVDEAFSAEEVQTKLPEQHPQILLIDLGLPSAHQLSVMDLVAFASHYSNVVLLSSRDDDSFKEEAFRAGAVGVQKKTAPSEKLLRTIRLAARSDRRSYSLWPPPPPVAERRECPAPDVLLKS